MPKQLYVHCQGAAGQFAAEALRRAGIGLWDHPAPEVTHVLLDIPSLQPDGKLKTGEHPSALLERLPDKVTVIGGNLQSLSGCKSLDLLQDPGFLTENAEITAQCAIHLAQDMLEPSLRGISVLVIGSGRIGKSLCRLFHAPGASVTLCARNPHALAEAKLCGIHTMTVPRNSACPTGFDLVCNTVPAAVFSSPLTDSQKAIDLASVQGLFGRQVKWARGLPGKMAPRATGALIARTLLQFWKEESV